MQGDQLNTEPRHAVSLGRIFAHTMRKGKAVPLQAWTGLEGSRRLRLPDFKTIGT